MQALLPNNFDVVSKNQLIPMKIDSKKAHSLGTVNYYSPPRFSFISNKFPHQVSNHHIYQTKTKKREKDEKNENHFMVKMFPKKVYMRFTRNKVNLNTTSHLRLDIW